MAETKKTSALEDIKTAFAFIVFGFLGFIAAFIYFGQAAKWNKDKYTVKAQVTHYEYVQAADTSTETNDKKPEKEYYVTFSYQGKLYQNILLEDAKELEIGDELKLAVMKTYETNGQPDAKILDLNGKRRKGFGAIAVGIVLIIIGFFMLRKSAFGTVYGPMRLNITDAYTGIVKRCTALDIPLFDGYYQYLIAYVINNEAYWKRVQGQSGAVQEGTVLRIYTNPSNPTECRFDLAEKIPDNEMEVRAADVQFLSALPINEEVEKGTNYRSKLLSIVVSLSLSVICFILGSVLKDPFTAIFSFIGIAAFVFGLSSTIQFVSKLRKKS